MTDSFRTPPQQNWSTPSASGAGNGYQGAFGGEQPPKPESATPGEPDNAEVGKALLIGLLGGLVSAAGYLIYRRLPDEQRERLNTHVRGMVQDRITEIRTNFNI